MPNHSRQSRSRSRHRGSKHTRRRHDSPRNELQQQMQLILDRLSSLEEQRRQPSPQANGAVAGGPSSAVDRARLLSNGRGHSRSGAATPERAPAVPPHHEGIEGVQRDGVSTPPLLEQPRHRAVGEDVAAQQHRASVAQAPPTPHSMSADSERDPTATDRIIDAIRSINTAQATGKLDSGMRGPYRVVKALPHGRYELQLMAGSYGKTTQAAAEYMVPWRGEWTPDTCAMYFDSADENEESTPEQTAESCDVPIENSMLEPTPSTSRAAAASTEHVTEDSMPAPIPSSSGSSATVRLQGEENEDVLQSGEAVLAER